MTNLIRDDTREVLQDHFMGIKLWRTAKENYGTIRIKLDEKNEE